jgi:hypothetical protein
MRCPFYRAKRRPNAAVPLKKQHFPGLCRNATSVLDADLDVPTQRNRRATDRRQRYGRIVTLQQPMHHRAARAHTTRELTLGHLLLLHGPMQFGGELALDSQRRRLFSRSVILHRFVRVALRATSRLLPSHMYFEPLPLQGAATFK